MSDHEFDLHLAESTAQAAAIWLVLERLLEHQLATMGSNERSAYLEGILSEAETISLPFSTIPEGGAAMQWIAERYSELIESFVSRHATSR